MDKLKILLADDEPGALRFLMHIIRERCPCWEVVDSVENGRQALTAIAARQPDMVLTDIRMPVMDGLELARQIRTQWPGVRVSLISGYEDFGAAQDAMRLGVSDYLLKPVIPSTLVRMLDGAREQILQERRHTATELILSAMAGGPLEPRRAALCFGGEAMLNAAFVRAGALVARSSMGMARLRALPFGGEGWFIAGRDDSELFVFQCAQCGSLETQLARAKSILPDLPLTEVVHSVPFAFTDINRVATLLTGLADRALVLGVAQRLDACRPEMPAPDTLLDAETEQRAAMLASAGSVRELRELVGRLFDVWGCEKYPLQLILRDLIRLLGAVARGAMGHSADALRQEQQLDGAMACCRTLSELKSCAWALLLSALELSDRQSDVPSSEAFFERIQNYIEQNLSSPITLQSTCTAMGISQTYMSRIFRRHTTHSFNEYLTARRIERAKQLILSQPELPLKAVAELVGFKSQFYFSKVFRAVEGIPPSQFQGAINE